MARTKGKAVAKKMVGLSSGRKQDIFFSYAMLSPLIIGFLAFTIYPIIWALCLAWFHYDSIPSHTYFSGLENFITAFTVDMDYWHALGNTFLFAVCKLPIEITLALFLAVLLNSNLKGRGFFRAAFYLPNIISMAIIGLIFYNMFAYFGVINSILDGLFPAMEPIDWFSTKPTAFTVIVAASIWQTFGINMLYFLAALQNIPTECYESAKLDGAGRMRTFFSITLPLIAPTAQIILLLAINGTLMTSDLILVLTNGNPGGSTEVVMTYVLKRIAPGFADSGANIGYGSALAVITSAILAMVALIYMKASHRSSDIY